MPPKHSHKASNSTSTSRKSAPQTLRGLFGAGSTIQATRIDLDELGPDWLDALVQELNWRFGLALRTTDDVFALLKTRLRFVAGQVDAKAELVTRKEMATRLKKLKGHVGGAIQLLAPVRPGLVQRGDFDLIVLLGGALMEQHAGMTPPQAREHLEPILATLEALQDCCDRAQVRLTSLTAKTGRSGMDFYDALVVLMEEIAGKIGLPVTVPWDPSDEQQTTAFTVLVYEVERLLPRAAWSNTLAACAKRIERSLSLG
jgi:hypothetical protein